MREEGSGRCRPIVRLSTGLRYSGLETFLIKLWILLPRRDLSLSFTFIGNKFIRNIFVFSPLKYSDTVELSALLLLLEIIYNFNEEKGLRKEGYSFVAIQKLYPFSRPESSGSIPDSLRKLLIK